MNFSKILSDVALKCAKHEINLRLESVDFLDKDTLACSGYFDEKTLAVATKKDTRLEWVLILLHEFCHLKQWAEDAPCWVSDKNSLDIVEGWVMENKTFSKKRLLNGFRNAVAVELDCEKRTIKLAKKYEIKFNRKVYIQQANAYLYSYVYALHNRQWCRAPYNNQEIWTKMPEVFLKTSQDYFDTYTKYESCFNK